MFLQQHVLQIEDALGDDRVLVAQPVSYLNPSAAFPPAVDGDEGEALLTPDKDASLILDGRDRCSRHRKRRGANQRVA